MAQTSSWVGSTAQDEERAGLILMQKTIQEGGRGMHPLPWTWSLQSGNWGQTWQIIAHGWFEITFNNPCMLEKMNHDIHVSAPAEVTDVVRIGNSKLIQCLTPVHNTKWTALPPYIQKTPKKSAWEPPSVITPMHWQKTWPLTILVQEGT